MNLTPAPLYDDVADGPEGGRAYWLTTSDNVRIRIGVWGGGDKGTVLLFPGRTEFIEKYGAAAKGFLERGFSTVAIDWRGQGLADRALDNRQIGHVDEFQDFQKDVDAVMAALPELGLSDNLSLFAHSMGGNIGLRALMNGLKVNAAAFSGPMWGIALDPFSRGLAWTLSSLIRKTSWETLLTPTTSDQSYVLINPFEGNLLTRDEAMYDGMKQQLISYPDLGLGGPSLAWINEALKECRDLSQMASPDVPSITFLGTNERIVDQNYVRDRMKRWPKGELHIIEGGEHEVVMDYPHVQAEVLDAAVALYEAATAGAAAA